MEIVIVIHDEDFDEDRQVRQNDSVALPRATSDRGGRAGPQVMELDDIESDKAKIKVQAA